MKKHNLLFIAIIIFSLPVVFSACTKDSVTSATEQALISKAWAVDYYFDNQDMTSEYTHSKLLFSSTGAVGYQSGGQVIAGQWSRAVDATNQETITLQFNTSDVNVEQLNHSWKVMGETSSSFQFEELDGSKAVLFRLRTQ